MQQKLENLTLVSYDDENIEHRRFKRQLLNDEEFKQQFGDMFIKKADEIFQESEKIELKKAYLLLNENDVVGMIRIFNYHESGMIMFQYAVRPKYRNQGYSQMIIKEFTDFLLENNISCVKVEINDDDIGNIEYITSLGFKEDQKIYKLRRNNENRYNKTEE